MDEDRLKHSVAVGRKMVEIGKVYGLGDNGVRFFIMVAPTHRINLSIQIF